jgi:hypothetical protein
MTDSTAMGNNVSTVLGEDPKPGENQQAKEAEKFKPRISKKPIEYGVELQFVYAFKESLLDLKSIEKRLTSDLRNKRPFNQVEHLQIPRPYNSWGIYHDAERKDLRPYGRELLEIAHRHIQPIAGLPIDIVEDAGERVDKTNARYKKWHITPDHTVRGVGSAGLTRRGIAGVTEQNEDSWDSYGLELVSRVLRLGNAEDLAEIKRVTDALKSEDDPEWAAFVTNQTGLHVHVGVGDNVGALRELALLLIVYEDEISRMHPPCRRPDHACAQQIIESNRTGLYEEMQLEESDDESSNENEFLPSVRAIRTRLDGFNQPEIRRTMGSDKTRLVSFMNIVAETEYPTTVEFRQHRGDLCLENIKRWIFFVAGLWRLADQYRCDNSYRVRSWDDRVSVFDLMVDMGMSLEDIDYYRGEIARYTHYPPDGDLNATDHGTSPPDDAPPPGPPAIDPTPIVPEQTPEIPGPNNGNENGKRPATPEPLEDEPDAKKTKTTTTGKNPADVRPNAGPDIREAEFGDGMIILNKACNLLTQ